MKRTFFSFIRPCLSMLDNGKFYRKPFGWLYAVVAITFLLSPFFLVFTTIWWNKAYQDKLESQRIYKEIVIPEFQKIKYRNDTLTQVVENYGKEMNNAIDCLTKATKQADYYGEYASYGPEYQQIYSNALDIKHQWEIAYKQYTDRWDAANAELDALKPKYDAAVKKFQDAKTDVKEATDEFNLVNQFGTIFKGSDEKSGNSVLALVLFSIMIVLLGALNFLLWWSRLLDLKTLIKVQDKVVAMPVASHFIQTLGESLGMTVGIWGLFAATIQFTCHVPMGQFGLNFAEMGIISVFLPIVFGFLIMFVFRIAAEFLKAVTVLANHVGE